MGDAGSQCLEKAAGSVTALGLEVYIAGWVVPLWLSFVAVLVATYLSFSLWTINQNR